MPLLTYRFFMRRTEVNYEDIETDSLEHAEEIMAGPYAEKWKGWEIEEVILQGGTINDAEPTV